MEAAVAAVTSGFAAHQEQQERHPLNQRDEGDSPANPQRNQGRSRRRGGGQQQQQQQQRHQQHSSSSAAPARQGNGQPPFVNDNSSRGGSHLAARRGRGGRQNKGRFSTPASASASDVEGGAATATLAPATQITTDPSAPSAQRRRRRGQQQQQQQQQSSQQPRYRSQLTESAADPSSSSTQGPSSRLPVPTEEELEQLSYRERLTVQLNTSSIDCPICINSISRKQPIACCRTCSAPYHLKCLRDWAVRSIETVKEKAALTQQQAGVQIRANWRCPSCQTQYGENEIPKNYWCFCGRLKDPKSSVMGDAHSCEKPCKRERPEGCNHSCPLLCHPANCDPCGVMLRMRCHCDKEDKTIKCGTLHPQPGTSQPVDVDAFLSCGNLCNKVMPCGLHRCGKKCHAGGCGECEIVRDKSCYCGKVSKTEICGGIEAATLRQDCVGFETQDSWLGEYSCGQPCPWPYACGKHQEADLISAKCHPHTSPQPLTCPRSPTIVTTCPCGQTPLTTITSIPRQSCEDPIPSCGSVCSKIRPSCGHACQEVCHEGGCKPCSEMVTIVCRCGNEKKTIKCSELQAQGETELRCERACKALRACGRHECGRKCCPLAYQEANKKNRRRPLSTEEEDPLGIHTCDRICGRKLNCGIHTCDQPDHRGPCPPCLRSSFEEIACHCGSTVLMPPVPCSTRIVCSQPCDRPGPPCGHPKAPHTCHEEEACPPCPFLVTKTCQCERHSEVKNVRCSQTNISCGKPCGSLLGCGYHRCRKLCHPPGECEDCTQTCGKARAYCGHPCQHKCHAPSKCPTDEPCPQLVEATCPCGNIKQRTRCGSCNAKSESNGGIKLTCTPACAVAQRNAALADALGISKERAAGQAAETLWEPATIQYYSENPTWCRGIEQVFLDFIKSTRATHMFPAMKHPQRKFVHEVAEKFKLRSESLDEEPFRSVLVARKAESAAPKPSLTEAWLAHVKPNHSSTTAGPKRALVTQTPPPLAAAPSAPKQEINALYLEQCFGYDEQSLKEALVPYLPGIYLQLRWITDEDVLCLPQTSAWTPSQLAAKLRLVRNSLRNKLPSCKSISTAVYDPVSNSVVHRENSWSSGPSAASVAPTQPTSTTAPPINRWANSRLTAATSALESMSLERTGSSEAPRPRPSSPPVDDKAAGSRTANASARGTTPAARPVSSIVQPALPASAHADVAEDWEDTL